MYFFQSVHVQVVLSVVRQDLPKFIILTFSSDVAMFSCQFSAL
jgi:hypothetical protein